MNVLIPDSWLRDFIKTRAKADEIAKALSLCSVSVEKICQKGGDRVYEIEVPPNRYDCLSVLGIAREAAATLPRFGFRTTLSGTVPKDVVKSAFQGSDLGNLELEAKIEDHNLCSHFAAIILDNISVKPSPKQIQSRLGAVGIRSLNNVVDATNYIMIELGQPMHAFDFDKLAPAHPSGENLLHPIGVAMRKMILRESRVGERLKTLDGVLRLIPAGSIVIEDGEKVVDLCGIMGGENSAIDNDTKRVILFAQIYEPTLIRRTSMSLPLRTEAAQRFEKGLDPEMVLPALYQAVKMLTESAGAVASKLIDINNQPFKPKRVELTMKKLNSYLGVKLNPVEVTGILKSLGFTPTSPRSFASAQDDTEEKRLGLKVPSWRANDIAIEEDLIEEVARIYGYHNLPATLPKGAPPFETQDKKFAVEKRLKYLLKDLGFSEVYTSSMVPESLTKGGELKLKNPINEELVYMRIDLVPSLLKVIEENRQRSPEIKIFEMANGYIPTAEGKLPQEKMFLTCLLTLDGKNPQSRFVKVKGLLERIFKEFDIVDYTLKPVSSFPYDFKLYPFDPGLSAIVWPTRKIKSGKIITPIGKIKGDIYGFQIHLEALVELIGKTKPLRLPPEHPPIIEDLSLYVDETVPFAEVEAVIKKGGGGLLSKLTLIDYFQDKAAKKRGEKSFTFRLTFLNPKRSLSEKDIKPIRKRVISALENFGAKVRSAA